MRPAIGLDGLGAGCFGRTSRRPLVMLADAAPPSARARYRDWSEGGWNSRPSKIGSWKCKVRGRKVGSRGGEVRRGGVFLRRAEHPLVGGPTLLSGSPMPRQPVFDDGQKASLCRPGTVPARQSIMVFCKTPAIFTMDDETPEIRSFASPECSGDKAGVVYLRCSRQVVKPLR